MTHLSAKNLNYRRNYRTVFENVSFSLESGQAIIVQGANGSGKTTLLKAVLGLISDVEGEIKKPARLACHYIGHENALKSPMTVRENLTAYATLNLQAFDSLCLEAFDLEAFADWQIQTLSAGLKRRAALSRLFAFHAPVWILDEPTVNLDTAQEKIFYQKANDFIVTGGMLLLATHQDVSKKIKHAKKVVLP